MPIAQYFYNEDQEQALQLGGIAGSLPRDNFGRFLAKLHEVDNRYPQIKIRRQNNIRLYPN